MTEDETVEGTRFTIETSTEAEHRNYLAGPTLLSGIGDLDNELRSLVKHNAWPTEIPSDCRDVRGLADWVRQRIGEVIDDAGAGY